jgi:hypothetical protein
VSGFAGLLMELGLSNPDLFDAKGVFEKSCGFLAIGAFKPDSIDLHFAAGLDDYLNGFHAAPPSRTSLIDPSCNC